MHVLNLGFLFFKYRSYNHCFPKYENRCFYYSEYYNKGYKGEYGKREEIRDEFMKLLKTRKGDKKIRVAGKMSKD